MFLSRHSPGAARRVSGRSSQDRRRPPQLPWFRGGPALAVRPRSIPGGGPTPPPRPPVEKTMRVPAAVAAQTARPPCRSKRVACHGCSAGHGCSVCRGWTTCRRRAACNGANHRPPRPIARSASEPRGASADQTLMRDPLDPQLPEGDCGRYEMETGPRAAESPENPPPLA